MRLSELIGRTVVTTAGDTLGKVRDALLVQDGPVISEGTAAFRLHALAVSQRSVGVGLGYAQGVVDRPAPLRWLFGASFVLVPWSAIRELGEERVLVDHGEWEIVRGSRHSAREPHGAD